MKMIQYDINLRKTRRLKKFKEDKITTIFLSELLLKQLFIALLIS